MERWREHFEEILNRTPPPDPAEVEPPTDVLDICTGPPSKAEIRKAIASLKNGKAAGIDGIPPEAWKEAGSLSVEALYPLLIRIWQEERIPLDWRKGILVKLPKKGDLTQCKNWRGIMLLSVASKLLCRIILNRTAKAMECKLRDNQAGFRPNRSCSDQIATLRIIVEQSAEFNSQLYAVFVDYEKAFDSLDRSTLWNILDHYGIPTKIISMVKVFYNNFQAQVSHGGDLTEPFNMTTGVRQGCLLSPLLFITALDWVMRETTKEGRTGIQWTLTTMLDDLDFADDLALLSHSISQMRTKTQKLETNSSRVGLKISAPKTKEMRVKTVGNARPVCCQGTELELVKEFTYLGSVISNDGGTTKDVEARIGKAKASFAQLKPIWRARNISVRTKLRILEANVKSVLLYGCETWGLTQLNIKKLQTFINSRLRFILGIWWPKKISNVELLDRTGQEPVEVTIRRRKWRWVGHTLRKPPAAITRTALEWNPQGKRKRGRPRLSWRRGVRKDLDSANTSWQEAKKTAGDRKRWRLTTEALCSRRGEED
ncbi:Hypp3401 [Branchiostoma lanceolatum]|uniref:Hypp3401 protein n=1 Tax=Branchiostoma lanceolatum TaxID=7740 RepID=A0A8K0A2T2_BRALA|nr:Hypp3401 [Branchiostoma lanceolatum]